MIKGKGPAATMASKRIRKEIADLAKEDLGDIELSPNEANIFAWKATIPGPAGSPYEGGVFDVSISIPDDYPFAPPKLVFMTKVYHCNIAPSGAICLDLLKHAWSPALSLYKVILSLSSLLTDPNPSDPLVPAIAQEYRGNRKKHDATARDWTKLYAIPKAKPQAKQKPPVAATSRPSAIRRTLPPTAGSSSSSTAVPPPVTGRRRRDAPTTNTNGNNEPIVLGSDNEEEDADDNSDVEILGENGRSRSRIRNQASASTGTGTSTAGHVQAAPKINRPSKKPRTAGGGETGAGAGAGDDDVIVIDD